jgi:oxygen-dependent protoporphyrinogen oxidase
MIGNSGEAGRVFVVRSGAMIPLPDGIFPAPSSMAALFNSQLLSMRGKLRMTLEPFLPRGDSRGTGAASHKAEFGREAYERIASRSSPVYMQGPRDLSIRAALPALVKMEEEYGSVARG